jgi:hypothetical protein
VRQNISRRGRRFLGLVEGVHNDGDKEGVYHADTEEYEGIEVHLGHKLIGSTAFSDVMKGVIDHIPKHQRV